MKTEREILGRLKKLGNRYARKYIDNTQKRCYRNCRYNWEQVVLPVKKDVVEFELTPRCVSTVVVVSDNDKANYCTYGVNHESDGSYSVDTNKWNGIICNRDEIAEQCEWFTPALSVSEAEDKFNQCLEDDKWVYENYRDIAALQWVLGDRVYNHPASLVHKVWLWLKSKFHKPKPPKQLPASKEPKDIWDDPV